MTAIMRPLDVGAYAANGSAGLRLRPLGATDLAAVERHLLALAPADRRARFLGDPSDAVIAAHARGLDPSTPILIGAIDGSACLIGLAEAHLCDAQRIVEVAVSVDVAFRRRGVGRRLVARILALAFARGAESAEFVTAPDNHALACLVRGLGGQFRALGHFSIRSAGFARRQRSLPMPAQMLAALQVNLAAGRLPTPEAEGRSQLSEDPAQRLPARIVGV
jgi:ribosomal protein S18 acetylase RimI-like enzyme